MGRKLTGAVSPTPTRSNTFRFVSTGAANKRALTRGRAGDLLLAGFWPLSLCACLYTTSSGQGVTTR